MFGFRIIGIRTGVAVLGVGRREGVVTVRKHVVSVGRITSRWIVVRAACCVCESAPSPTSDSVEGYYYGVRSARRPIGSRVSLNCDLMPAE